MGDGVGRSTGLGVGNGELIGDGVEVGLGVRLGEGVGDGEGPAIAATTTSAGNVTGLDGPEAGPRQSCSVGTTV